MADSIMEKLKDIIVGDYKPPLGNVDNADKNRDPSYQGEGIADTYTTHDECGAVPVTKAEEAQAEEAIADS